MWLIKGAPNLVQRLSGFPGDPDVILLDRRQSKPFPEPFVNTTYGEQIYISVVLHQRIASTASIAQMR